MEDKEEKQRTDQQRKSLEVYCREIAQMLNESGITYRVLIQSLDIDNSQENIKDIIRTIGTAKYKKISTADLTTKELQYCYEEFNRIIAKFGVHLPWPSEEEMANSQIDY